MEKGQDPGPKGLKKRHSVVAVLPVQLVGHVHKFPVPFVVGFSEKVELHTLFLADVREYHAGLFIEKPFAEELLQCQERGFDEGRGVGSRGG